MNQLKKDKLVQELKENADKEHREKVEALAHVEHLKAQLQILERESKKMLGQVESMWENAFSDLASVVFTDQFKSADDKTKKQLILSKKPMAIHGQRK